MKKLLLMAVSLLGMTGCLSEAKSTNTPLPQATEQKETTPHPAAPETQNDQEERYEVTFNGQVYKARVISGAKAGIERIRAFNIHVAVSGRK
ncbi:hypothetical protein AV654_03885 [Paenibacillus elgii]|uniref:Lipoprotein n=1 Tax=Paenibacillus elgii TaxID=189691 RepID=A0A163URM6_9BACL|nr:hypothetical protein [Paenibacillus elgii]KZE73727.1 hypothetical protein AV654_03885 [Paenibacillus elgii]